MALHGEVCSAHIHSRAPGTHGRKRGERGRPEEPGASCPTPPMRRVAARGHDSPSPAGPQAYATVTVKPTSPARLLQVGAVVLISGAALLLFGAIGAFYFWKGSDNHVSPEGGCRLAGTSQSARGREGRGAWGRTGWLGPLCHSRVPS